MALFRVIVFLQIGISTLAASARSAIFTVRILFILLFECKFGRRFFEG
jgi:hypothetical protein